MAQKSKKTIGIGILSWRAHETLKRSLDSYPKAFLDFFDETVIYFSDISDEDKVIADDHGWDYSGAENEGIAGGMKRLAECMTSDYVLLLQNDNPLCEDADFAIEHIRQAVDLMEDGRGDLARMRHRWKVGEGFADVTKYLKYYPATQISDDFIAGEHGQKSLDVTNSPVKDARRLLKKKNAKRFQGRSVFIEENPQDLFPQVIQKCNDFFEIDSSAIDFTDQCLLISRDKWLGVFMPYVEANPGSTRSSNGFLAPELCINGPWWRNSHFKVLQGQGVFTHARYDGSFRDNHHTKLIHNNA